MMGLRVVARIVHEDGGIQWRLLQDMI